MPGRGDGQHRTGLDTPVRSTSAFVRRARPWLLLAPGLAVISVLLLYPLLQVVLLSFQDKRLRHVTRNQTNYNGVENYKELFASPELWSTVLPNTVLFCAVNVVLTLLLGTLVALLLARLGRLTRAVATTAILAAWAMPAVTGTYVWVFIFDARDGIATRLAHSLGLLDPSTVNLFTNKWVFLAIATLNVVHHSFPFVALTVLAGILTIPDELVESARMDGASGWQRFRYVTFPMLRNVFAVVTILSIIWDFKVFTQLFLMPGGDGGNKDVLVLGTWSYLQSFAQNRYGFGSAIAVVLTVLLLLITLVYLRVLTKEEEL